MTYWWKLTSLEKSYLRASNYLILLRVNIEAELPDQIILKKLAFGLICVQLF
jgi:hypothetical protein